MEKVKNTMQIDVIRGLEDTGLMLCKLYVTGVSFKILMNELDYNILKQRGIFIRDGKNKDSAGVLNTTKIYEEK